MKIKVIETGVTFNVPWEHGVRLIQNKSGAYVEARKEVKKEKPTNSKKESK